LACFDATQAATSSGALLVLAERNGSTSAATASRPSNVQEKLCGCASIAATTGKDGSHDDDLNELGTSAKMA